MIYDIFDIERQIEEVAAENQGEITPELLEQLYKQELENEESVLKMVKLIKHLEYKVMAAKLEVDRLREVQRLAQNKIDSVKDFLLPYVHKRGAHDVGTFRLSTRKSKAVHLVPEFNVPEYMIEKIEYRADKKKIMDDLKAKKEIPGASLKENISLQIR